MVTMENWGKV